MNQAHEQNNGLVRVTAGAVGLSENPSAFRKRVTARQEQTKLLKGYIITDMGDPFLEDTPELLILDAQDAMDESVV